MADRSHIINGHFLHNLNGWVASGATYSAGDGDDHYGVAVLSTGGDYIDQSFAVNNARLYTFELALKPGATPSGTSIQAIITDGGGNTVVTQNLTGTSGSWVTSTYTYGLASGTTYTLKIINNSLGADLKVDDVWIWYVPLTRIEIARRIHTKLGRLSSNRALTFVASGVLTEGDYTYAVDAGLRNVGAINPLTGKVDIRYLTPELLQSALDLIEREMLEQLHRDYSSEVDIQVGPRREQRSQIVKGIEAIIGISREKGESGGGGRVITRKMIYD